MNFSAKNPRHRKAAKRYLPPPKDTTLEKKTANYSIQQ